MLDNINKLMGGGGIRFQAMAWGAAAVVAGGTNRTGCCCCCCCCCFSTPLTTRCCVPCCDRLLLFAECDGQWEPVYTRRGKEKIDHLSMLEAPSSHSCPRTASSRRRSSASRTKRSSPIFSLPPNGRSREYIRLLPREDLSWKPSKRTRRCRVRSDRLMPTAAALSCIAPVLIAVFPRAR